MQVGAYLNGTLVVECDRSELALGASNWSWGTKSNCGYTRAFLSSFCILCRGKDQVDDLVELCKFPRYEDLMNAPEAFWILERFLNLHEPDQGLDA